jgi:lipopolysaccharide/colanic/teichoic acid biosynthesis glycosyltransferase
MRHQLLTPDAGIEDLGSSFANGSSSFYARAGKRLVDLIVSACGVMLAAPILIGCACAIKLESGSPILFRQQRVGRRGKLFTIFKFRSMRTELDSNHLNITVAGDPRITTFGKWLRKAKLDELPQLFNVLSGDMSLIGPRPEVPEYVRCYDEIQRLVLQVRPGITGPSALQFIDEEDLLKSARDPRDFYCTRLLPRKVDLDLRYCQTMSFRSDCAIAVRTLLKLFTVRRLLILS